jgi:hypothetical protein
MRATNAAIVAVFFDESCHVPFLTTTLPLNDPLVADLLE